MTATLPVLVARVPDRGGWRKIIEAALQGQIAWVAVVAPPRSAKDHILVVELPDGSSVRVHADPIGAPADGRFPFRLRPAKPEDAKSLRALVGADAARGSLEGPGAGKPAAHEDPRRTVPSANWSYSPSPEPKGVEVAPWTGSIPPPVAGDDPRRTAPSARWRPKPSSEPSVRLPTVSADAEDEDDLPTSPRLGRAVDPFADTAVTDFRSRVPRKR